MLDVSLYSVAEADSKFCGSRFALRFCESFAPLAVERSSYARWAGTTLRIVNAFEGAPSKRRLGGVVRRYTGIAGA